MKRVGFSITSLTKEGVKTYAKGMGYLSEDGDLLFAMSTKDGKPYIKVFDKVTEYCHQQKDGSKSGFVEVHYTAKVPVLNKNGKPTGSTQDVELTATYRVWYTEK